jgi:hypothetical protein
MFRTCAGAAWEVTVCHSFLVAALAQLGRVRELRARARVLLEEARARGDRYSIAFFQSGDCVLDALGRDQPLDALAGADAALVGVPDAHFTSQHFGHLVAVVRAHLYMGDGARAWKAVDDAWPALQESGFLSLEGIGVLLHSLRGTAALAAADGALAPGGVGAARARALLREAERAARKLRRVSLPTGPALSFVITAGVHAQRGAVALRSAALESAIAGFDAVDMALHRESARLVLGLATRREDDVRRAYAWMREEAVRDPIALARATIPGPLPHAPPQDPRPILA